MLQMWTQRVCSVAGLKSQPLARSSASCQADCVLSCFPVELLKADEPLRAAHWADAGSPSSLGSAASCKGMGGSVPPARL